MGLIGAFIFTVIIIRIFRKSRPDKASKIFKFLQLVSASAYAISHGINDAQKSMGIISMALLAGGINKTLHLDHWVIFSCYAAISLGTMLGGWRIVKTMGTGITKIRPMEGFFAETSSAVVLFVAAHMYQEHFHRLEIWVLI